MADSTHVQTNSSSTSESPAPTTQREGVPSTCCGGPAPIGTNACCERDADAKAIGAPGCGCATAAAPPRAKRNGCCG